MSEKKPIITVKGLKTHFPVKGTKKVVRAVDGVDLVIYEGETLGIVGESGCGKTTLGKSILQLIRPTDGECIYEFEDGPADLCKMSYRQLDKARREIQIVFQDPQSSLNPSFTVYQSMSDPLKKFGLKTRAERRKRVGDLLEEVNMQREYMDRYPSEFSGGQRQRIGIARALATNPKFVVCDEAVSALDVSIQAQIINLLQDLKEKEDLTYLFITHDLSVVKYISDRIGVMYLGNMVELADSQEIFDNPVHPYTEALLNAIPTTEDEGHKDLQILEGDIPSPVNPPKGCKFHTRCAYCTEICKQVVPEWEEVSPNHFVACHHKLTKKDNVQE